MDIQDGSTSNILCNSFVLELNYGLALPSNFYKSNELKKDEVFKTSTTIINSKKEMKTVQIELKSNVGLKGGYEDDVLLALMTIAKDQEGRNIREPKGVRRVYYTYAMIAEMLNHKEEMSEATLKRLIKNSIGRVSKAIKILSEQNIRCVTFLYQGDEGEYYYDKPDSFKPLIYTGTVSRGKGIDGFEDCKVIHWAEFDERIFDNLSKEYMCLLNQNDYLNLKVGPQRQVYRFLCSKRQVYGNEFKFNLSELARMMNMENSNRRREVIKKHLDAVSKSVLGIDFHIRKMIDRDDWDILIEFSDAKKWQQLPPLEFDETYQIFQKYYGLEFLNDLDFVEADLLSLRNGVTKKFKKATGSEFIKYNRENINVCDMIVDIILFQCKYQGFKIQTWRGLVMNLLKKEIEGNLDFPDGYRSFVTHRLAEKEKLDQEEKLNRQIEREEEIRKERERSLNELFNEYWITITKTNKQYVEDLRKRAEEIVLEEDGPDNFGPLLYEARIDNKARLLAKEEFVNGDFVEIVKKKSKKNRSRLLEA
ncbi:hypothetical protein [Halobacteriovorax sp. CON-3]|uniref:hypothetical protein n=1 Tax=Halobacteriovorax sp. CON-3 TaxID=3157710 RepID=UPI003722838A